MPKEVDLNQTVTGLQSMLARLIREDITLSCERGADARASCGSIRTRSSR